MTEVVSPTLDLPRRVGGYAPDAVERLLGSLRSERDAAGAAHEALARRALELRAESDEIAGLEHELAEVLLEAQRAMAEERAAAEQEAAAILAAARRNAAEERATLERDRARILEAIADLDELDQEVRARARALLEEALVRLGEVEAERAARAAEEPAVEAGAAEERAVAEPAVVATSGAPETVQPQEATPATVTAAPLRRLDDTLDVQLESLRGLEEEAARVEESAAPWMGRSRRTLAVSLGILALGTGIAIGIWQLARAEGAVASAKTQETLPAPQTAGVATVPARTPASAPAPDAAQPVRATTEGASAPSEGSTIARVALRAVGGDTWVSVHRGSASGKLLFEGFLYQGESRRFEEPRIWLRVGNPATLALRVNGESRALPNGTADLVITSRRIRLVSLG